MERRNFLKSMLGVIGGTAAVGRERESLDVKRTPKRFNGWKVCSGYKQLDNTEGVIFVATTNSILTGTC